MKHTILNHILLGFCVLAMVSCEGLLEENPKSVAVENFYNTPEDVESAVNAIYTPLRSIRAEQIVILDAHSDWGYGRGSRAQYNDFAGLNTSNANAAGARWDSFYKAIRNANLVIANAPNGDAISQEEVDFYVAEARFLRALTYFDLVRNWGGVPLRTEENMQQGDLPRSTVDEVYALIVEDLRFAEQYLDESPRQVGRPTVYAAKTLLADVYLNLGDYEMALQKSGEVIRSGNFSLVPVTSVKDIQTNIFGADLLTSTEEIFYFKYSRDTDQGNFILWILNHPDTGHFNFGGAYAHYGDAANPFYTEWDDADLRKGLWDQVDFGLGTTTLVSSKYVEPAAVSRNDGGNDLPVYRYAEVLLIFAEAEARVSGGPTSAAIDALNQVHRRAYGLDSGMESEVDLKFSSGESARFLEAVLQERGYEFQFEGKRWLDLKRTGKAQEMIMKNKGLAIAEAHYLWPIPISEINFNGAINPETDQNPGY
ncbi:RagB/SusD family nutrient uptake outer membrane protein [Sinomicrobium pectinilyticum]|uniref:RagB/SusD family nutrient uptake outer membrane protein n=1 Tax=Sinomicrobium pectinilyticum TaxID=1084421 RepID=A0A3N0E3U1_SINP1|nr:RagB/SusD family nutrient uptake outer membrane protein [Sinomicrobium pectinilyticum]RNL82497.1 RagB/SusD family nutrient uptake outer membrane protein [Sinomicrobium pectinilyticum]